MANIVNTTISWLDAELENTTIVIVASEDYESIAISRRRRSIYIILFKWVLRLVCLASAFVCPWANYQLIRLFQTRSYHKQSSAKWYIIFKAIFDTTYLLMSGSIIFFVTFRVDIVHRNAFTCKVITYLHYTLEDLISFMLVLLCIDRMVRITYGYRLRTRCALTVCISVTVLFMFINIHHFIRLTHIDGACHKTYFSVLNYEFDIFYSAIFTIITWTLIFIACINLTISVGCDRFRRQKLQQQLERQEQKTNLNKILLSGGDPIGASNDQLELINNTDEWDDPTSVTIEQNDSDNRTNEVKNQDDVDLQLTVCVLIASGIFLVCNMPHFIIFIMKYVHNLSFSTFLFFLTYLSLLPMLISHTINYFIFNHLAARLFPNSPS